MKRPNEKDYSPDNQIFFHEERQRYYAELEKYIDYLEGQLRDKKDGVLFPCNRCKNPFDTAELVSVGEMTKDGDERYTMCKPCADEWLKS